MTVAYTNTVYNEKDYNTLCRIVEAEAGGEDTVGKIMVANVILNRVAHSKFPDTVTEVVYASGQFSPVSSGKINRVKISSDTQGGGETGTGRGGLFQRRAVFCGQTVCGLRQYALV